MLGTLIHVAWFMSPAFAGYFSNHPASSLT